MDHLFKPVKKVKLSQDIVLQIQEAIFTGQLKVGHRLPSEKTLQRWFQASAPTIGEAIKVLEYQGLIQTRPGEPGKVFVKSRQPATLADNFTLLIRSRKVSVNDLAEFREKIEGEVVKTAAVNATDLDICHLKKLIGRAEGYSRKSRKSARRFVCADINFHLRLSEIAQNPLYHQTLGAIYGLSAYYKRFFHLKRQKMKENLQDLYDIVSAFSDHNPGEAEEISRHHILKFNAHF